MESRKAMWAVAGPLIAFKVFSIAILFNYAPSRDAIMYAVVTSWTWVVALGFIVAAPTLAWYRLVKVRARREQLRRSEWMLDEQPGRRKDTGGGTRSQWLARGPLSADDPEG